MSETDKPKPRKHKDPNWQENFATAVVEASKRGDQAFHAWSAGRKVFMDIVPGVQLTTIEGNRYVWDGEEWNLEIDESDFASSSVVQFNTGDDDLDILMQFAIDFLNELAGIQEHENYKLALQQVLLRLKPA